MSTQNPNPSVTVPHPFEPDSAATLEGEHVDTARRADSPYPWAIVRVGGATIRVPSESLSD
jgi:hypothetical protein